jgi:acetyl-CoA acetyltransferase
MSTIPIGGNQPRPNPSMMIDHPHVYDSMGITAGNSSQMSDGAAFVVVMSAEKAAAFGCRPIARLAGYSVVGVAPEIMGIGPLYAIPKVLKRCGYALDDIDLFELNEAFAAQSLACIRELGLDTGKVNVNGGVFPLRKNAIVFCRAPAFTFSTPDLLKTRIF